MGRERESVEERERESRRADDLPASVGSVLLLKTRDRSGLVKTDDRGFYYYLLALVHGSNQL